MDAEQMTRLAHAVSVLLAEMADRAAWEAACLLEGTGVLEWATWENVSPKDQDAGWRLTGWTTDKNHLET